MTVIDEKPVPLYIQKCSECGSTFTFKKVEVSYSHITCPVCGITMWASFQRTEDEKEETNDR